MVGQDASQCGDYNDDNDDTQAIDNCAVLNARVHNFEVAPIQLQSTGEFAFISTRYVCRLTLRTDILHDLLFEAWLIMFCFS